MDSLNTPDSYNPALNTYNSGGAKKYDVIIANSITDTMLSPNQFVATDVDSQLVSRNLIGTNNQVNVNTSGSVTTLSTPQNIDVTAVPEFKNVVLTDLSTNLLLGTDASGEFVSKSLLGTTNQAIVTTGTNSYTISTPQDIATTSLPTFKNVTLTDLSANSLLGTDASGHFINKSLLGTVNQAIVTAGTNSYTISTPQDIATTSTPTFKNATLTDLTANSLLGTDASGAFIGKSLLGTTNRVIVTPGTNSYTLSTPQDLATFSSPTFNNVNANGTVTGTAMNCVNGGATVYVNDPGFSFQNSKLWLNCSNTPSNKSVTLRLDGAGSYSYLDCSGVNGMDFTLYGTTLLRMALGGYVSVYQWLRMGQSGLDAYFGCENASGKYHWQFSPYSSDAMTLDCSGNIYSPSTQPCQDPSGNGSANYGALVVKGGIGCNEVYASTNISATNSVVGYSLVAGNRVQIFGATNATNTTSGSFINAGGAGIAKDVYIGGLLNVTGAITASNLSGTNTGNVTLTAVGSSPNANAASISGQALTIQPADGSNPGVLTAGTQTIGGAKSFNNNLTVSQATNSQINIATTSTSVALLGLKGSTSTNDAGYVYYTGSGTTSGGSLTVSTNNPGSTMGFWAGGTNIWTADVSGIKFTNSTASYTPSYLNYYEEYSATPTWSDGATAVVATSGNFKFYMARIGKVVNFYMALVQFSDSAGTRTSNITAPISTIPTRFLPSINNVTTFPIITYNGTTRLTGRFEIGSSGNMFLACDNFGGNTWGATNNECRGVSATWVVP